MNDTEQLLLPTFEGIVVDTFELGFGGKVELDLGFETDDSIVRACKLGEKVKLTVEGTIVSRPFSYKEGKNNGEDRVTSGAKLRIDSIVFE